MKLLGPVPDEDNPKSSTQQFAEDIVSGIGLESELLRTNTQKGQELIADELKSW
jgi:hypothetical protein